MTEQHTNPAPYVYPEPGGDETLTVTRDGDDVHIAASNEAVEGGGGVTYVPIADAAEVADAIRTAAGLPTVDAAMAAAVRSALEDFAAVVVGYCPDHGDRDPARVTCHCPIARELRATAAAPRPARGQGEARQATPCGPIPDQCDAEAGDPCADHERQQAHAEGEHAFCGPECPADGQCEGEARQPEAAIRAKAFHDAADFMRDAHFRDGMSVQEIGTALRLDADALAQQPASDA